MTKKVKTEAAPQTNDEFEAALKSEVPEKAQFNPDTPVLGIVKTDTGFAVVKVMVDSKTLVTGQAELITTAENKWEANEQFKINVIKLGII